jgi:hypothetical protein
MAIILFQCRQHPGHLLCEGTLEDLPIEGPPGIDEDDLVNSAHNMKLSKVSFQVDRYKHSLLGSPFLFVCLFVCLFVDKVLLCSPRLLQLAV